MYCYASLIFHIMIDETYLDSIQGSHTVLKVLNFEIGFEDLEKVLSLAKMFIKY